MLPERLTAAADEARRQGYVNRADYQKLKEELSESRKVTSSKSLIAGGCSHPSATYRPWNIGGSALISSIPNVHKTVPVQKPLIPRAPEMQ